MERKKCQICDGPIVNGRCKLCGMPYRNDEVLYHLNENRSEHYKHAGQRAKEIMRRNEVPLGDRTVKKPPVKKQAVKRQGQIRPSGRRAGRAQAGSAAWIAMVLIFVIALGYNFYTDREKERVNNREVFSSGEELTYALTEGSVLEVGGDVTEGAYIFYSPAGSASVRIKSGEGIQTVVISEDEEQEFDLKEGDVVTLTETQYEDQELWIWEQ